MNHKVVSVSDEEHKVKCQQNSNEIEDNQNEDNITDIPEIKDNQDDDNTTNGDRKELVVGMNSFQHSKHNDNDVNTIVSPGDNKDSNTRSLVTSTVLIKEELPINNDDEAASSSFLNKNIDNNFLSVTTRKLVEELEAMTGGPIKAEPIMRTEADYQHAFKEMEKICSIIPKNLSNERKRIFDMINDDIKIVDKDLELEEYIEDALNEKDNEEENIGDEMDEKNKEEEEEVAPHSTNGWCDNDLDNMKNNELKLEEDNEEVVPHTSKRCVNDLDKEEGINVWKKHEKQKNKLGLKDVDVPYSPKRCVYCGWVSKSRSRSNSSHSINRHIKVKHQSKK